MEYRDKYELWLNSNDIGTDVKKELKNINDEKEIEDRFFKDLEFGTGGLRGIVGAGTNRMNIYTVGKATQGLSDYLKDKYQGTITVCIGFDSRIMSKEFAETAACILSANGIKVNLFENLRPTPMVSYSIRDLKANAGIVITASHNPSKYNGYKVYGADGGQVTDMDAKEIFYFIDKIKKISQIKRIDFNQGMLNKSISLIGEGLDRCYYNKVIGLTINKELVKKSASNLRIIYTPIHGTGNVPVRKVLSELGYKNLFVVKEQEKPDGNFPTAPCPNPEEPKVFNIALKMAKNIKPDIIFGTDPDCDRIGVVVKDCSGNYKILTGNQVGVLLTEYILKSLKYNGCLGKNGTIIKTIVTTDMAESIAKDYEVEVINVLTGFKYIGEKIKEFEAKGNHKFIFAFEESYGYLMGQFVRDKDAIIASMLICEMALYYKNIGISLYDQLMKLYNKYGFYKEELISIQLEGKEGIKRIKNIMNYFRESIDNSLNDIKIIKKIDYKIGVEKDLTNGNEKIIDLPKSNVLKFVLEDKSWIVIRPSGTEPKIKVYLSVIGDNLDGSDSKMKVIKGVVNDIINCSQIKNN